MSSLEHRQLHFGGSTVEQGVERQLRILSRFVPAQWDAESYLGASLPTGEIGLRFASISLR